MKKKLNFTTTNLTQEQYDFLMSESTRTGITTSSIIKILIQRAIRNGGVDNEV